MRDHPAQVCPIEDVHAVWILIDPAQGEGENFIKQRGKNLLKNLHICDPSHQNTAPVIFENIVIFHLSERAFYQLKDDTAHVQIGCSIAILWSKVDLYFLLFSMFIPHKLTNTLKCIHLTNALF